MDSPGGAGPTAAGRAPRPPAQQAQAAQLAPPVRAVPGEERCAEPARPAVRPVAWSARPAERQAWGRRVAPEVVRRAAARPGEGPEVPVRTSGPRPRLRSGAWRAPAAVRERAARAARAAVASGAPDRPPPEQRAPAGLRRGPPLRRPRADSDRKSVV